MGATVSCRNCDKKFMNRIGGQKIKTLGYLCKKCVHKFVEPESPRRPVRSRRYS